MNISENSWHFELVSKFASDAAWNMRREGTTLCKYFWTVIFAMLNVALICAICVLAVGTLIIAPAMYYWIPTVLGQVGFAWWLLIAAVYLFILLPRKIAGWIRSRRQAGEVFDRKPNILVEYVKAKKARFCPIVEIVHED